VDTWLGVGSTFFFLVLDNTTGGGTKGVRQEQPPSFTAPSLRASLSFQATAASQLVPISLKVPTIQERGRPYCCPN
jgi:hypothetical protein